MVSHDPPDRTDNRLRGPRIPTALTWRSQKDPFWCTCIGVVEVAALQTASECLRDHR